MQLNAGVLQRLFATAVLFESNDNVPRAMQLEIGPDHARERARGASGVQTGNHMEAGRFRWPPMFRRPAHAVKAPDLAGDS